MPSRTPWPARAVIVTIGELLIALLAVFAAAKLFGELAKRIAKSERQDAESALSDIVTEALNDDDQPPTSERPHAETLVR